MGKLERSIIVLLAITIFAYILKFDFGTRSDNFMTYESATTPNAVAKRFEPFQGY